MTALSLAISPCPNDTFAFHALAHGLVPSTPPVRVTYADIDVTNTAAEQGAYDIVKVSYAALPWLLERYSLLPCGGALGRGCGPLVLTAEPGAAAPGRAGSGTAAAGAATPEVVAPEVVAPEAGSAAESAPDDPARAIAGRVVAIPSERSTAYLLFRLWSAGFPPGRVVTMPFHEIMPAVRDGRVGAGLVIHEARFTYHSYGLRAVADLGDWWERETGLPIPLGAVLARRGPDAAAIAGWVRQSVRQAWADPGASRAYVAEHAQELEPDVIRRHIDLYVNAFTEDLGAEGLAAAETLLGRAADAGLVPPVPADALRR